MSWGRLALTWFLMAAWTAPLAAEGQEQLDFFLGRGLANYPLLSPFGRDRDRAAWFDGRGLRVRLPVEGGTGLPVGIEGRFQLPGDFEATADYEVLAMGKPTGGEAAGVTLLLQLDTPTPWQVSFSRLKTARGDIFQVDSDRGQGTDRKDSVLPPARARTPWGRLRLTRTGPRLQFAAADGTTVFQEIGEENIARANVKLLRYVATNSRSRMPLDVRLLQLSIQTRAIVNESATLSPPRRIAWPWYLLGAGLLAVATILGFRWVRYRRATHVPVRPARRVALPKPR